MFTVLILQLHDDGVVSSSCYGRRGRTSVIW